MCRRRTDRDDARKDEQICTFVHKVLYRICVIEFPMNLRIRNDVILRIAKPRPQNPNWKTYKLIRNEVHSNRVDRMFGAWYSCVCVCS